MTEAPQHWLDRVLEAQERSVRALDARTYEVTRALDNVGKKASEIAHAYEEVAERRVTRPGIDHAGVIALVRAGRVDALSHHEARFASTLFDVFSTAEMLELLRARPRGWRHLFARCLREWEQFARLRGREDYIRMFREAPRDALHVQVGLDASAVLGDGGVTLVARGFLRIADCRELVSALRAAGLSWRWEFTAYVVTHWFLSRREHWSATLPHLLEVDELRWALLPPSPSENSAHVRSTTALRADVVAKLIKSSIEGQLTSDSIADLTKRLLESSFRDPRFPPLSEGWSLVERADEKSFRTFMSQLVRDDLQLFFAHAMDATERGKFWLQFLESIRATMCVFDRTTRRELKLKLNAGDELARSALKRVFATRQRAQPPAQAFCLFFDNIVAVEFSHVGNALYVYPRATFEEQHVVAIRNGSLGSVNDLKKKDLPGVLAIAHGGTRSGAWQGNFSKMLREYGIYSDVVLAARRR